MRTGAAAVVAAPGAALAGGSSAAAAASSPPVSTSSVAPAPIQLHFTTAARRSVQQSIPLPNPSSRAALWKSRIEGEHWAGEPQLSVAPRTTGQFVLSFRCDAVQQCRGSLSLRNRLTGDELQFALSAECSEPLPDESLSLAAQARQSSRHSLSLRNDCNALLDYRLESDLPGLVAPASVRVAPQSSVAVEFTVCPALAGLYPAHLSFSAFYDGRLLQRFFPVRLSVRPPLPSSTLRLQCAARAAVTADMEMLNPSLTEDVEFAVEVEGRDVRGHGAACRIAAASSATFSLTFAPLLSGSSSGAVSFLHPVHGEFLHRLELEAAPPAVQELPQLKVEIGSSAAATLWLDNPVDEEIRLRAAITPDDGDADSAAAFHCRPESVLIAPRSVARVELSYSPTRLHSQRCSPQRLTSLLPLLLPVLNALRCPALCCLSPAVVQPELPAPAGRRVEISHHRQPSSSSSHRLPQALLRCC